MIWARRKKAGERFDGEDTILQMTIPNAEIRYVYRTAIREWFDRRIKETDNTSLFQAMLEGDARTMAQEISQRLFNPSVIMIIRKLIIMEYW